MIPTRSQDVSSRATPEASITRRALQDRALVPKCVLRVHAHSENNLHATQLTRRSMLQGHPTLWQGRPHHAFTPNAMPRECIAIITRDVDSAKDACRFQRLAALIGSAGDERDIHILHAVNGSVTAPSVRALRRLRPGLTVTPQPAASGSWRLYGGKITGYSKASFLLWLLHDARAASCTHTWQIEDDVFFTGAWRHLFAAHESSSADLIAAHEIFSTPQLGGTAQPCFINQTTHCEPVVVIWPLLRISRRLAAEVATVLAPSSAGGREGKGFHEWLTGAACRHASWPCAMSNFNSTIMGRVSSGHSPGLKVKIQQSLENVCGCGLFAQRSGQPNKHLNARMNRTSETAPPYPPRRAFHPVKCDADALLGSKALSFAGIAMPA